MSETKHTYCHQDGTVALTILTRTGEGLSEVEVIKAPEPVVAMEPEGE